MLLAIFSHSPLAVEFFPPLAPILYWSIILGLVARSFGEPRGILPRASRNFVRSFTTSTLFLRLPWESMRPCSWKVGSEARAYASINPSLRAASSHAQTLPVRTTCWGTWEPELGSIPSITFSSARKWASILFVTISSSAAITPPGWAFPSGIPSAATNEDCAFSL